MKVYLNEVINSSPNQDKLKEIYKKDKHLARVYFMSNSREMFYSERVKSYKKNSTLHLSTFRVSMGISVTSKMYSHTKNLDSIVISPKGVFRTVDSKIFQMKVVEFVNAVVNKYQKHIKKEYIIDAFPWLEWIFNQELGLVLRTTSMSFIVKNKISSYTSFIKKLYKENKKLSEQLIDAKMNPKYWKKVRRNIRGQEFKHIYQYSNDAIQMAFVLDRTINLNWSERRWEEEHDSMSKEITTMLSKIDNRNLKVHEVFVDFSKRNNVDLISTTGRLSAEGAIQHHCVASYAGKVDSGRSGIYHINGYTLELIFSLNSLRIGQVAGKRNSNAPNELRAEIERMVSNFNYETDFSKYKEQEDTYTYDNMEFNELAF